MFLKGADLLEAAGDFRGIPDMGSVPVKAHVVGTGKDDEDS